MRDRTVNRVESWDARPFSGGFATLRDMADASFSGVVVSGDAWLFVLNGRVVGIVDGDIDEFEDASGTMYEAPDPSLPLLFSMQERGGTTQAKYYTNDTPLQEADKTLSDANFTGYVELSENVLSGDYYLVYYGGRLLPVAFVGTTDELKTGDDAYDLAADEVGVYEVIKTPVNVTQIPDPRDEESGPPGGAVGRAGAAGATTAAGAASGASSDTTSDADGPSTPDAIADAESTADAGSNTVEPDPNHVPEPEPAPQTDPDTEPQTDPDTEPEPGPSTDPGNTGTPSEYSVESGARSGTSEASDTTPAAEGSGSQESASSMASSPTGSADVSPAVDASDSRTDSDATAGAGAGTSAGGGAATSGGTDDESPDQPSGRDDSVFSDEEQWRQSKAIPSLSPSEREKRRHQESSETERREQRTRDTERGEQQAASPASDSPSTMERSETTPRDQQSVESSPARDESTPTEPDTAHTEDAHGGEASQTAETVGRAESAAGTRERDASPNAGAEPTEARADVEARIAELEERIEELGSARDAVATDLESVREERDELERRVRELEQALEAAGGEPAPGPVLSPAEALAGTNLFIRYGSKGQPTLDDLVGKNPDREAINKNLRIDHHTQFEAQDATVDGRSFQQFLEDSSSFRFVSWLVRELPYEILDSGRRSGLADFYDVVPDIDRAELQGVVGVETEDGQERREFDVVLRDRMGNPLVVAELNDERDPVSGDEMEALVESAQIVGDGADGLGAAFYVTASFFEPNALENAGDATANGGILSRSDRMSYVKLARKQGFHLCLTEDRNETFHLTVPEL